MKKVKACINELLKNFYQNSQVFGSDLALQTVDARKKKNVTTTIMAMQFHLLNQPPNQV